MYIFYTMTDPQIEYVFYFRSVRIWTNLKIFWLQIEYGKMNSRPADRIWPFTQVWTHWLYSRQSPRNGPRKSSMNIKIPANITKSRKIVRKCPAYRFLKQTLLPISKYSTVTFSFDNAFTPTVWNNIRGSDGNLLRKQEPWNYVYSNCTIL